MNLIVKALVKVFVLISMLESNNNTIFGFTSSSSSSIILLAIIPKNNNNNNNNNNNINKLSLRQQYDCYYSSPYCYSFSSICGRRREKNTVLHLDSSSTSSSSTEDDGNIDNIRTDAIIITQQQQQTVVVDNVQEEEEEVVTQVRRPLCFYKSPINQRWKQRIDLQSLQLGQELQGVIVQETLFPSSSSNNHSMKNINDLTTTTETYTSSNNKRSTGPKIWLDVGVCRWSNTSKPYIRPNHHQQQQQQMKCIDAFSSSSNNINLPNYSNQSYYNKGGWKICTALLRLGDSQYVKESVIRKKVSRLRNKPYITVYVSRILLSEQRLEVVLSPEEVPSIQQQQQQQHEKRKSALQLKVGDIVTGTVTKIMDYGVHIQINGYNTNRCNGLLHISKVAELYNTYIDKKDGLIEAGFDIHAQVQLQICEIQQRRRMTGNNSQNQREIFLDFTTTVKDIAKQEQLREQQEMEQQQNALRIQLQLQRQTRMMKDENNNVTTSTSNNNINDDDNNYVPSTSTATGREPIIDTTTTTTTTATTTTTPIQQQPTPINTDTTTMDLLHDNDNDNEEQSNDNTNVDNDEDYYDDEDDEEGYDSYDEEREIEDALGLGSY